MNYKDQYLQENASYERLLREYNQHGNLIVGFDFDGTVHDFHKIGAVHSDVIELLRDLKSINCTLICWTAYKEHEYVIKFLEDNNIPFDGINTNGIPLPYETRKPFFNVLLDDRAGMIQVYKELRRLVDYIKNNK